MWLAIFQQQESVVGLKDILPIMGVHVVRNIFHVILEKDFSGFDQQNWPERELDNHRSVCNKLLQCTTNVQREKLQTQTGIEYSVLIELPYFDPIRFTIVDPMHNLFLGTAKHVMKNLWLENLW